MWVETCRYNPIVNLVMLCWLEVKYLFVIAKQNNMCGKCCVISILVQSLCEQLACPKENFRSLKLFSFAKYLKVIGSAYLGKTAFRLLVFVLATVEQISVVTSWIMELTPSNDFVLICLPLHDITHDMLVCVCCCCCFCCCRLYLSLLQRRYVYS
jgi:hypothetical protein